MRAPGFKRSDRIAEVVRDTVARLLRERVSDPRVKGAFVTHVAMPGDMHVARVYWYFLKDARPERIAAAEHAFVKAAGLFEGALAQTLRMKRVPEVRFMYDRGIDHERHIEVLLASSAGTVEADAAVAEAALAEAAESALAGAPTPPLSPPPLTEPE